MTSDGHRATSVAVAVWLALVVLLAVAGTACAQDRGSPAAFCREARRVPDLSATLSGFSDADPAELKNRLATIRQAYGRLEQAAPGRLRGDTEVVVALVDDIIEAVRAHPNDPDAVVTQTRRSVAQRSDATEAARTVAAYASRACNLELYPADATTTSAPLATTGSTEGSTTTSSTAVDVPEQAPAIEPTTATATTPRPVRPDVEEPQSSPGRAARRTITLSMIP